MNFSSFRAFSLSFASFLATAVCATAQLLPEKEEDIPVEFIPRLENIVSIGFNKMKTGPKVRFGNLGMIAQPRTTSADESDTVSRLYSNGSVLKDSRGTYEKDLQNNALLPGVEFSTPAWKSTLDGSTGLVTVYTAITYAQTNPDGTLVRNDSDGSYVQVMVPGSTPGTYTPDFIWAKTSVFRGYVDGQARSWDVQNASQIVRNGSDAAGRAIYDVSMSAYGVTSAGASVDADSTGSSGFELSLEHKLGQRGRFEWGIAGGLKLVGINAKASAVIPAYLTATTDVYKTVATTQNLGAMPNISQPSGDGINLTLINRDGGGIVYQYTTPFAKPLGYTVGGDLSALTPLDVNPANITSTSGLDPQGRRVNIQGEWQLKGAYYLMRLGPTFRYRFNDTFAVSGTVGLAQGWVGTTFKANEAFDDYFDVVNANGTAAPLSAAIDAQVFRSKEENVTRKFVSGIYGELNVEYWMTERTGFYVGVTQQTMRDYSQRPLSGRTAKVDLGSTSGWKIGVMTRF